MNKWLSEIEIYASNVFGKENCRQFVDETRPLVDGVYEKLKRNVRSRYGKVVVLLAPQSYLDKFSTPSYEYDNFGGICTIYYSYDLKYYLDQKDQLERQKIVYAIFKDAFSYLPEEVGLNGDEIMPIVDSVYRSLL